MKKLGISSVLVSVALGVLAATACGESESDSNKSESEPTSPGGGSEVGADGQVKPAAMGPPARSEFGLDVRPSNTTCLAPTRPPAAGAVKLERVFENVNLEATIGMAQPPGDKTRWFVASRSGKIVSFPAASPPADPPVVADLAQLVGKPVLTDGEGGLLGFAFHPKFRDNGRIYVTFTTTGPTGIASEVGYVTSTDGGASFSSYAKVFGFDRTRLLHNGGGIAFDKEGHLFLGFGDGTIETNGQRIPGFYARVLRLDVDHPSQGKPYGIPTGNPYRNGQPEPPEVYAKGLRNPFRLSVDRATGDLWVGDVGHNAYEEINKVEAGGNYGWPCREGAHDHRADDPWQCPSKIGLVDPVFELQHIAGGRAVIGGVVYRGAAMPAFQGTYVYGDFGNNELWALTYDAATGRGKSAQINEQGPGLPFTHFAEDDDGEIYGSSVIAKAIYKLVPLDPTVASSFPDRLSKTGCVDPANPTKPAPGVIPFTVNVPLWSDGGEKERALALPDNKTIGIGADGDFDFPPTSVLLKTFSIAGKRIETRLLVRHDDGQWAGYTYEWTDDQTDALLLHGGKAKPVGDQIWTFPSRGECMLCHTAAAGSTLGLELGQLNGDQVYASTNRIANQLKTLEHIGLFSAPLGKAVTALGAYPNPFSNDAPLDARARAYLHSNCSMCHRPNGGPGRAPMDFRFATPFADTKTCNVASGVEDLGVTDAKILAPGDPAKSLISVRMHATDRNRMPPIASRLVDDHGVKVLDDWIRGVTCP